MELLKEMTNLLAEQSAQISALRSMVGSLIAIHPEREALQRKFLDAMDLMADATPPNQMGLYRQAHQVWLQALSVPTNR